MNRALVRSSRVALLTLALVLVRAGDARSQSWSYPSFQLPRAASRELNFGIAGDGGTTFLAQWREGYGVKSQLSLDGSLTSAPGGGDMIIGVFGQFGYQLLTENASRPVDVLFTLGAGAAFCCSTTTIRVPVGVSVGKTFPLEGAMAVTPFVHPKISFDHFSASGLGSESDVNVVVDLGADLKFTPTLSGRAAVSVSDDTAVGISLAWHPARR